MASRKSIKYSNLANHQIPSDVILDILVWLPVKILILFKSVCKEWYALINSPLFIRLHLNKSLESNSQINRGLFYIHGKSLCIFDDVYHPLKVNKLKLPEDTIGDREYIHTLGSCNGLVCVGVKSVMGKLECLLICNPSTRTLKLIFPPSDKKWPKRELNYAFGYDVEHDDYKIVATRKRWTKSARDVRIYSLKSDLWRFTATNFGRIWKEETRSIVYGNKMLHYLVYAGKNYRVARFDLCSEKWTDDLRLPVQVKRLSRLQFGELDGNIYISLGGNKSTCTQIWITEEYGAKDDYSWRKMVNISKDVNTKSLVAVSMDGQRPRLLLHDTYNVDLSWYDQDGSKETVKLPSGELHRNIWEIKLGIASLVPIPGSSIMQ